MGGTATHGAVLAVGWIGIAMLWKLAPGTGIGAAAGLGLIAAACSVTMAVHTCVSTAALAVALPQPALKRHGLLTVHLVSLAVSGTAVAVVAVAASFVDDFLDRV